MNFHVIHIFLQLIFQGRQGDHIQGLLSGSEDGLRQKWRSPISIFQALFALLL